VFAPKHRPIGWSWRRWCSRRTDITWALHRCRCSCALTPTRRERVLELAAPTASRLRPDCPRLAPLTLPARRAIPWASLLPRYWIPVGESSTDNGTSWAPRPAATIPGSPRLRFEVLHNSRLVGEFGVALVPVRGTRPPTGRSLRVPELLEGNFVFKDASWSCQPAIGLRKTRERASLQTTFIRPRFRTYTLASIGGELEEDSYSTRPDTILKQLSSFFSEDAHLPPRSLLRLAGRTRSAGPQHLTRGWESSLSASGRQRWKGGTTGGATRSLVGTALAYKSLDCLFAHHVLAFRAAGGITDDEVPIFFRRAGSVHAIEVFPVLRWASKRRTFGPCADIPLARKEGFAHIRRRWSIEHHFAAPLRAVFDSFPSLSIACPSRYSEKTGPALSVRAG